MINELHLLLLWCAIAPFLNMFLKERLGIVAELIDKLQLNTMNLRIKLSKYQHKPAIHKGTKK